MRTESDLLPIDPYQHTRIVSPTPAVSAVGQIPPQLQLDMSAIVNVSNDVLVTYPNVAGQHGPGRRRAVWHE